LTEVQRTLIAQAATLAVEGEKLQAQVLKGKTADSEALTRLTNATQRVLQLLGATRRQPRQGAGQDRVNAYLESLGGGRVLAGGIGLITAIPGMTTFAMLRRVVWSRWRRGLRGLRSATTSFGRRRSFARRMVGLAGIRGCIAACILGRIKTDERNAKWHHFEARLTNCGNIFGT
jgi:hypothetical protein